MRAGPCAGLPPHSRKRGKAGGPAAGNSNATPAMGELRSHEPQPRRHPASQPWWSPQVAACVCCKEHPKSTRPPPPPQSIWALGPAFRASCTFQEVAEGRAYPAGQVQWRKLVEGQRARPPALQIWRAHSPAGVLRLLPGLPSLGLPGQAGAMAPGPGGPFPGVQLAAGGGKVHLPQDVGESHGAKPQHGQRSQHLQLEKGVTMGSSMGGLGWPLQC